MAHRGLVADILGHISDRVDADHLLVRCRGPRERGLRFTQPEDIRLIGIDESGDIGDGYRTPSELPIHVEILRRRPDVMSVVHVHPPAVVVAALAKVPLVPCVGAYNIPAMRLAEAGIPIHDRSVLISRPELAHEMLESMAGSDTCVLAGHGLVTTGSTPRDAMLKALDIAMLAELSLAVVSAGGVPKPISEADRADLPDLGPSFNQDTLWRHHLACLAADGWDLEDDDMEGAER